jgi:hypothetical protein
MEMRRKVENRCSAGVFQTFGRFENREKQGAKVAGKQGPILRSQGPIANLDMALW